MAESQGVSPLQESISSIKTNDMLRGVFNTGDSLNKEEDQSPTGSHIQSQV